MENEDKNLYNYNFLHSLIFRAEYDGIFSIDDCINKLQNTLVSLGFNTLNRERSLNIFELTNTENQNNLNDTKVFSFKNIQNSSEINITKNYISLRIIVKEYKNFQEQCNPFIEILLNLKNNEPFLSLSKASIRKVNVCYVENVTELFRCFNKETLNSFFLNKNEEKFVRYESLFNMTEDRKSYTFINHLTSVLVQKEHEKLNMLQYVIDIEGVIRNFEIKGLKNDFIHMNDFIFHNIFVHQLTEEFKEYLKTGNKNSLKIEGIKKND